MSKNKLKTTIYSLGRDLAVSPATVSKALRGSSEISSELRRKIYLLAKAKNFKPRLVSRKVLNLCVLVQQFPGHALDFHPFLSMVMEGVAQYTREEGLEMSIYADDVVSLNGCDIVRELRRRSMDGAIVLRSNDQSTYLTALEAEGFPHYALLDTGTLHPDHVININNVEVGSRATQHLIEKGHRAIGVLVSPPHGGSGANRLGGYRMAMEKSNLPVCEDWIACETSAENGLEFGLRAACQLLERNPELTALFAMDHAVTLGALRGLAKMGFSCPGDVSVISCDDYPETAYLTPALTVIDIPNRKLGYLAAKQVHRALRDIPLLNVAQEIDLNGVVIERESVAAPRK